MVLFQMQGMWVVYYGICYDYIVVYWQVVYELAVVGYCYFFRVDYLVGILFLYLAVGVVG